MEARKQERNVGTLYPALLLTPNTYQPTQSVFRPVVEWNISVVFITSCPIVQVYAGYTHTDTFIVLSNNNHLRARSDCGPRLGRGSFVLMSQLRSWRGGEDWRLERSGAAGMTWHEWDFSVISSVGPQHSHHEDIPRHSLSPRWVSSLLSRNILVPAR